MNSRKMKHTLIEHVLAFLNATELGKPMQAKTAEDALYLKTASEIRDFLEEIPGGFLIYRAGADESIIYANKALLHIFACESFAEFKEYVGNSFSGLVYPEDLAAVEQSIINQIEFGDDDLDYVEYRIKDKNGNIRWIEDYGHFVHDDIVGDIFYVFLTDATEKKQGQLHERAKLISQRKERDRKIKSIIQEYDKERQLINREHLRRLEVIESLSSNFDSVLYVDFAADDVLPYRLSTRIVKQFGGKFISIPYSVFVEDYVRTWVHPDDRARVAEFMDADNMRTRLGGKKTYYANFRCVKNGKILYLQIRAEKVGSLQKGKAVQAVIGYRNVDEEIKREMEHTRALEQALKTSQMANVAKNTFLSNMSHDMRTPLNAVFGFVELAKNNIDNPDAVRGYIDKIEAAGHQMLELVEKVLDLSYMESKDAHLSETPCNVRDIAKTALESARYYAKQKGLKLTLDVQADDLDIIADAEKLEKILLQIVGNAIKYTEKGGVSLSVEQKTKLVNGFIEYQFAVKDTGCGISPDALERIFEPFERERNTTQSGVFGLGVGLTIAKNMVELMGGTISAESEVGKGSVFTVTVKLRPQTEKAHECDVDEVIKSLAGSKLLVVEDNEINLELETEILEELGFVVDSAENGQIAVQRVKDAAQGEYVAVLMDIQMPVMDGRAAAEQIRKLGVPVANIPIIALSANSFESDMRLSLEAGMDAHLPKPIDVPLLMKTLANVIVSRKSE